MKRVKMMKQRLTNDKIIVLSIIAVAMFLSLTITIVPAMATPVLSDSLAQFITDNVTSPDMRTEVFQSVGEAIAAGASDAEIMQIITDSMTNDSSGGSVDDALETLAEANGDGSEMKDDSMAEANDPGSEMKDDSMAEANDAGSEMKDDSMAGNDGDACDYGSDGDDDGSGGGDGGHD